MARPRPPAEHQPADPVTPESEMIRGAREPSHKRSVMSDADEAFQLDYEPFDLPDEEIPGEDDVLRAGDPDVDPLMVAYSGEDAPGATNSTPDGNDVETIGRLYGVTGSDGTGQGLVLGDDLILPRDLRRWENNPDSKDSSP